MSREKKNNALSVAVSVLLVAIGITVGTGSYTLYPAAMYVLVGILFATYGFLVIVKKCRINILSNSVLLLYFVFLTLNYIRDFGDVVIERLYLNFFLGICTYLATIKLFSLLPDLRKLRYLPAICLIIVAGGIVLQLKGFINFGDEGALGGVEEGLLLRPGGFLNPNMSAALSLIWLFAVLETKNSYFLKLVCIAIAVFVLAITQSRAAWLFLLLYALYKSWESGPKVLKYYFVPVAILALLSPFITQVDVMEEVYRAILLRFQGDGSSDERYVLMQTAMSLFIDSGVAGGGMRAMYQVFGLGTHNEIVEWTVNFGVVGLFFMAMIFIRFYYIGSFKYLALCILPTFLFSHNFFETTAFQVALAFAFSFATRPEALLAGSFSSGTTGLATQRTGTPEVTVQDALYVQPRVAQ